MVRCDVEKAVGALIHKHTTLVLDILCKYMTEKVKAEVTKDSYLLVIPSGITKLLQPLDTVTNFPLKIALQPVDENQKA
jgi:hypothetical protein